MEKDLLHEPKPSMPAQTTNAPPLCCVPGLPARFPSASITATHRDYVDTSYQYPQSSEVIPYSLSAGNDISTHTRIGTLDQWDNDYKEMDSMTKHERARIYSICIRQIVDDFYKTDNDSALQKVVRIAQREKSWALISERESVSEVRVPALSYALYYFIIWTVLGIALYEDSVYNVQSFLVTMYLAAQHCL
jgi:hypothetical protein